MPHAELKYSNDLTIDAAAILVEIETVIGRHDGGAGACKGRAYPAHKFHHSHVIAEISLLDKPHRDTAFMEALAGDLEAAIKRHLHQPCAFSLALSFSPKIYITNMFEC